MSFRGVLSDAGLAAPLVEACAVHFALLLRWNRTHNLTRITDPDEAARRHYLDCLVPLLAWDAPASFADVGAGAGFPGLLAALAWPAAAATLVEPAAKRASFLRLAATEMGVAVEVRPPGAGDFARVLSRATFPPGERQGLEAYAAARASVAVWGHAADLAAWRAELSGWSRAWTAGLRDYQVPGLEPRALLVAG